MNPIKSLVVLVAICIWPTIALAQQSPQDLAVGLEQDERLRRESQQSQETFNQQRRGFKRLSVPTVSPPKKTKDDAKVLVYKFNVNSIHIEGASLLDPFVKRKLLQRYEASVLTIDQINQLIAEITNWYIDQGYITTRAYTTPQNIQDGELLISVVEGRIEGFTVNQKPLPWTWKTILIQRPGDILNLRKLEQSIQHLNRLRSVNATISIQPGSTSGTSVVAFLAREGNPYATSLSYDTYTDTRLDMYPASARFIIEQATPFWEANTISLSQANAGGGQNSHSMGIYTQVPFKSYLLSGSFNQFEYTQYLNNGFVQTVLSGRSKSASIELERLFARTQSGHMSCFIGFNASAKRNTVDTVETPASSYRLGDLSVGIRHFIRKGRAVFSSTTKLTHGDHRYSRLAFQSSNPDQPQTGYSSAHYNANFNSPFPIFGLPLTLNSSINAQWAQKVLHSERHMVLASHYSVRGLRDPSYTPPESTTPNPDEGPPQTQATGERGLIIRNEISLNLAKNHPNSSLRYLQPYVHLDAGAVYDNLRTLSRQNDYQSGAVGVGAGLKLFIRKLTVNMTLSRAIYRTHGLVDPGWVKGMSFQFAI